MEKVRKVYRNGVDKKISIKLTPEQMERVDRVLNAHGNNMSEVMRQALNFYMDHLDKVKAEKNARNLFNYHEDVPW